MTPEENLLVVVPLGLGGVCVGAAFQHGGGPHGLAFQPLPEPHAIGENLSPNGPSKVDFSQETVFITFANLESLEVVQHQLNVLREVIAGRKTVQEACAPKVTEPA